MTVGIFRNMRIGTKTVVLTLAVALLVFGVTVYVSISKANAKAMEDATTIASSSAATIGDIQLTCDKATMVLKDFLEKNPNFLDDYVAFESGDWGTA